jgi:hypothetical protein
MITDCSFHESNGSPTIVQTDFLATPLLASVIEASHMPTTLNDCDMRASAAF